MRILAQGRKWSWLHTPQVQKYQLFIVAVIGVFGFFAYLGSAHAASACGVVDFGCFALRGLSWVLYGVMSFFGWLLSQFFIILIGVAQYNDFRNAQVVVTGWVVVRDVSNMFFIFVLLIIAFGTLFQIQKYRYNALLKNVILMAILINFSNLVTFFFIDLMQVIALTFVNAISSTAVGNITSMVGVHTILGLGDVNNPPEGSELKVFATVLLATIMLGITCLVVLLYTLLFLIRIIALWLLTVLSPLAYLLSTFPGTAQYSHQWWSEFWKYATIGPVMAFMLWLALSVGAAGGATIDINKGQDLTSGANTELNYLGSDIASGNTYTEFLTGAGRAENITNFLVAIILLVGGLTITSKFGVAGGQMAGKLAQNIQKTGVNVGKGLSGMTYRKYLQRPLEQNVAKNAMGALAWTRLPILSTIGRTGVANLEARKKKQQDEAEKQMKNIDRHTWAGRQVRAGQMGQSPFSRAFRWTDYGAQARERAAVKMHPESANARSLASYIQDPRTESKEFANWSVSRIRGVRNQQLQWNASHPNDQMDFPHSLSRLSEEIVQQRESVATLDEPDPLTDAERQDPRKVAEYERKRAAHISRNRSVRSDIAGLNDYRYSYLDPRGLVARDTPVSREEQRLRDQERNERKRRQDISMLAEEVGREGGAAAAPAQAAPAGGGGGGGGGGRATPFMRAEAADADMHADNRVTSWKNVLRNAQGTGDKQVYMGMDFRNPALQSAFGMNGRELGYSVRSLEDKEKAIAALTPVFRAQRTEQLSKFSSQPDAVQRRVDDEVAQFQQGIRNADDVRMINTGGGENAWHTARHERAHGQVKRMSDDQVEEFYGTKFGAAGAGLLEQAKTQFKGSGMNEADYKREVLTEMMASSVGGTMRGKQQGAISFEGVANAGEVALGLRQALQSLPKTTVTPKAAPVTSARTEPVATTATPKPAPVTTAAPTEEGVTSVSRVATGQKPVEQQAPTPAAPHREEGAETGETRTNVTRETIRETTRVAEPSGSRPTPQPTEVTVDQLRNQQALARIATDTARIVKLFRDSGKSGLADRGGELQLRLRSVPAMGDDARKQFLNDLKDLKDQAEKLQKGAQATNTKPPAQ